jgi:hypothetical protein
MSPMKLIDLDEIVPDGPRVKLRGEIYELPPDLPAELYLWIQKLNAKDPDALDMPESEMVGKLYEEVLDLFRYKRPDLERLPIRLAELVTIIGRVYGEDTEDDAAPPPRSRSKASGGATSSRTRQARNRPRR